PVRRLRRPARYRACDTRCPAVAAAGSRTCPARWRSSNDWRQGAGASGGPADARVNQLCEALQRILPRPVMAANPTSRALIACEKVGVACHRTRAGNVLLVVISERSRRQLMTGNHEPPDP